MDVEVLDTPEVEEELGATTEQQGDGGEGAEPRLEPETESHERDTEVDTAPVISDANGQLKLSDKAKAELDRIKAENPRLAREMRAALFDRQTLLAKVPGGVKEALRTIEAYEAEGGSEAMQQVKEENKLWQDLDADFQAGDPKFVDDIAKGNPEAFAKIAPTVMAKYAELDSAGYTHEVSKVFAADMAAADVPLSLKLLRREIEDPANPGKTKPGMEGVAEIYNTLQAYADRINGYAKNAPKQEQAKPAVGAGASNIDQREQALTIREFSAERTAVKDAITQSELAKNAAGRKFSDEKLSTIHELYELALDKLVKSIPGHTAKVDRFLAAKDKAGYRKHMEAAIRAKAPDAMATAFRKAGIGAKPGPVAKPAAKTTPGSAQAATVNAGFTRSATKPDHNAVDWPSTARIPGKKGGDGKFIMRDGSKVLYTR